MKTANRSSNKRESSYGITGRAFNAEIDPLIAVIDLRKRFKSLEVLKGIDLYIKQGSVTVLIGPSGSGKSTLLRCINQLETIQGGDIQFELNYQDDEGDAEKAVNAYNTLKDWGMQLSLGSVTSKPCEATAAETYSDRIFALTPSASSTGTTEGKDNMFQMCFIDPAQGTLAADKIAEKKLGTKIAIIWKNDDVYSTGIHDKFVEEAKTKGLQVVSDNTFTDASANDFSVQLNDAKSKGADLVFLPMYYQPASLILTQANAMGYAPKFFGVDGMDGILTLEGFDTSLAEGLMLMTPFNANSTDEKTASFVKKYKEQFGETPNQFAADAYDCVYAYKQALENAGATPDMSAEDLCDKMIEQFTSMTFDGLTGTSATWSTEGAVTKDPTVAVIKDGKYVNV
mgnify:CR=1 FL=1